MKVTAALLEQMSEPEPYADSKPLHVIEVDLDPPGPGEVVVELKAAGLCHSDLSVINGSRPRPVPMVLGHEAAGVVVEVSDGVHAATVGDHVVFSFVPSCGLCDHCVHGRFVLCEPAAKANGAGTLLTGERRLHLDAKDLNHHLGVSGFATHAVVAQESVVVIDPDLPFNEAALFGCAVLTGVGAVINTGAVIPGESVGVFGIGGIGLSMIMGARAAGATQIVAVDRPEKKLADAKKAGATDTVLLDDDAVKNVQDLTHGGVDCALEAAGVVSVFEAAYEATTSGGRTVTVGLPDPKDTMPLAPVGLVGQERTLKGSYMGSVWPRRDIPRFIEMYQAGLLPIKELISAECALEDVNTGFDNLSAEKVLRQILTFPAAS